MFSPVPNERLLGGTRDLLFPVPPNKTVVHVLLGNFPGRFGDTRQKCRILPDVNLDHASLRQMDGFFLRPADVPHVGADTPIGRAQWSTRNTRTAFIFQ